MCLPVGGIVVDLRVAIREILAATTGCAAAHTITCWSACFAPAHQRTALLGGSTAWQVTDNTQLLLDQRPEDQCDQYQEKDSHTSCKDELEYVVLLILHKPVNQVFHRTPSASFNTARPPDEIGRGNVPIVPRFVSSPRHA